MGASRRRQTGNINQDKLLEKLDTPSGLGIELGIRSGASSTAPAPAAPRPNVRNKADGKRFIEMMKAREEERKRRNREAAARGRAAK